MSDRTIRQAQRRAAAGDPAAVEKLQREERRVFGGPYDHLIGTEVFIFGARKNFRGVLVGERAGALLMASLWEVDVSHAGREPQEEEEWPQVTEQDPAVIPAGTYQLVARLRPR